MLLGLCDVCSLITRLPARTQMLRKLVTCKPVTAQALRAL